MKDRSISGLTQCLCLFCIVNSNILVCSKTCTKKERETQTVRERETDRWRQRSKDGKGDDCFLKCYIKNILFQVCIVAKY